MRESDERWNVEARGDMREEAHVRERVRGWQRGELKTRAHRFCADILCFTDD